MIQVGVNFTKGLIDTQVVQSIGVNVKFGMSETLQSDTLSKINVGVKFVSSSGSVNSYVSNLKASISFPNVTVINPTAPLYHGFLTTSAQSYTFDGTVTSYNANGIDLRGKSIKYLVMELLLNPLANDYELNDVTGELTINKDLVPDTYIFFEYENV